ncbi:hypothetical protein BJV78DRAFT_1155310 [Lactifluus subvellereus]|nr:hypothetical protein BJV78DRAFT_1155310 [Lactifluus subvellereus]
MSQGADVSVPNSTATQVQGLGDGLSSKMSFTYSPVFLGVVMASFSLSSPTMATYAFGRFSVAPLRYSDLVTCSGSVGLSTQRTEGLRPRLALFSAYLLAIKIGGYVVVLQMQERNREECSLMA